MFDVMSLSGLPWDVARTPAAIQCLNGGYQFLFQLDSDVLVPKDPIPRLLSPRLPIVSGLYHQRFPTWSGVTADYLPCMFNEAEVDGKLTKQAIVDYKPGSLVEAAYIPGGCLLIHRSVFEQMIKTGIKRFFEWTLQVDAEPPGSGRSEDFEFCAKARSIGFKCFCDTSIIATHETGAQVGVKGLLPRL